MELTTLDTSGAPSASWQHIVERFFRDITVNRLRRGVFTSVPDLVAAKDGQVAHHSTQP